MLGTCVTCKFFAVDISIMPNGRCKRYPPTLFHLPIKGGIQEFGKYPPTQPTETCGEYAPKLQVVGPA